ncbi:peptide chain release factor 2 [Candidatus Anaplasma sp. TIGMIC]|uniref:peptide chain release factor 2 n=1 Tax=Candidatus Anaplasma sp. TIGMIC TaxID=3020713 RepID=UPI003977A6A3
MSLVADDIATLRGVFDIGGLEACLEDLDKRCSSPSLWDDADNAKKLLSERAKKVEMVESFRKLEREYRDLVELIELEDGDTGFLSAIAEDYANLKLRVARRKTECMFRGEADSSGCFLTIRSGAGGTESNDWVCMLLRMYTRWAESHHSFSVETVDSVDGEEAGLKAVTLKMNGEGAYGWAKTESGIHRLVRISPFDSAGKRHTSFASVEVSPIVNHEIDIKILEKDLRVDTYRASGAGGQHVNKTESAVRITHIPSGMVVQCQTSRSQHQNRAEAFSLLKSRLYELELQEREKKMADDHQNKCAIGWGHQIRSYVLHPYRMVKDLRTGFETGNVDAVMDGDLDPFITAAIVHDSRGGDRK